MLLLPLLLAFGCVRAGWAPPRDAAITDGALPTDGDAAVPADSDGAPDGPSGPAYYISPTGDDSAAGTRQAPWRSWSTAISRLAPGDTLIALDGTYADTSSNRLQIDCSAGATACDGAPCPSGTTQAPITLRADNERGAHIPSGEYASLSMQGCSHWVIEGLQMSQSDTSVTSEQQIARLDYVDHVTLRRLLLYKPNRVQNSHGVLILSSTNVLVEECEVYDFHRYGIYPNGGSDITLRRNYVNSRDRADISGGWVSGDPTTGDSGIAVAGAQRVIVENNLVERGRYGIVVTSECWPAPVAGGGDDVRLLGNVVRATKSFAFYFNSFCESNNPCDSNTRTVSRLEVRDCVSVGSLEHGFVSNGVEQAQIVGCTAAGSAQSGYHMTRSAENAAMQCSVALQSCLAFEGGVRGFLVNNQASWTVDHCNSHGAGDAYVLPTGPTASSQSDPQMGGCYLYVPAGSPMKGAGTSGADIGASVVWAYENGAKTQRRLWDQSSGAFLGCGATVAGVNDPTTQSCVTVHQRLHVGSGGCAIP